MDFFRELIGNETQTHDGGKCPVCRMPLELARIHEIDLHRCPQCQGSWMSFSAFEQLDALSEDDLEAFQEEPEAQYTFQASGSPRACPECEHAMIDFLFRDQLWLDWCPEGHGMWLDKGEVRLVHRLRAAAEHLTAEQRQDALNKVTWKI